MVRPHRLAMQKTPLTPLPHRLPRRVSIIVLHPPLHLLIITTTAASTITMRKNERAVIQTTTRLISATCPGHRQLSPLLIARMTNVTRNRPSHNCLMPKIWVWNDPLRMEIAAVAGTGLNRRHPSLKMKPLICLWSRQNLATDMANIRCHLLRPNVPHLLADTAKVIHPPPPPQQHHHPRHRHQLQQTWRYRAKTK